MLVIQIYLTFFDSYNKEWILSKKLNSLMYICPKGRQNIFFYKYKAQQRLMLQVFADSLNKIRGNRFDFAK